MVLFWWAVPVNDTPAEPGRIIIQENTVLIGTGEGCLRPEEIEVNGRILKDLSLQKYFKDHEGEIVQ
jgi:methionyl-tRNA formyltransferase